MAEELQTSTSELKQRIRKEVLAARRTLSDRESRSGLILANALALPELAAAEVILIYVDCRSEVQTRAAISELLSRGKMVVVPWCRDDKHLGLFHLRSLADLKPGRFGIPEPTPGNLADPGRDVAPSQLDLLLLPGVAFDRRGGRLGHGRGYFDRLLAETRPDAMKAGLAFECQIVPDVPSEPHDMRLDAIVTEVGVYRIN
jgi:5-formyltetrahydrofolate cyclo-ligase